MKLAYAYGSLLATREKLAFEDMYVIPAYGPAMNFPDPDYYRLHEELRKKGYTREERERMLRNDFSSATKDVLRGAGLITGGTALGGALGYNLPELINMEERNRPIATGLGAILGGLAGTVGASKVQYDIDQEALALAEQAKDKTKKRSKKRSKKRARKPR
tara:strand:- start:17 stop:499 length:483 start_codon:yes stop_codon:yes gene_type:complete